MMVIHVYICIKLVDYCCVQPTNKKFVFLKLLQQVPKPVILAIQHGNFSIKVVRIEVHVTES